MHNNTILFLVTPADVCSDVGGNMPWIPHMTGVGEGGASGIQIRRASVSIKKQLRGIHFNAAARLVLVSNECSMLHEEYFSEAWCVLFTSGLLSLSCKYRGKKSKLRKKYFHLQLNVSPS